MPQKYFPPKYLANGFNCPNCGVYSSQCWMNLHASESSIVTMERVPGMAVALCFRCKVYSIWIYDTMIFPAMAGVEPHNEDLPEDIVRDYNEAANIVNQSPRGSAALLRLAIQKLLVSLGEKGKKIDQDIASLVAKGLPPKIQQALDIVRVIGNEAVHPGQIDLRDDPETAQQLFGLINIIADEMISRSKHIDAMYNSLPAEKLKGIAERDKKL